MDQKQLAYDETGEREWFVVEIEFPSSGSLLQTKRRIHFTFNVFPPGEFPMGSPEDEESHNDNEALHTVKLTRPLPVSTSEVTWGQFNPFDESTHKIRWANQFSKELTLTDPAFGINWFEAVAYCRWLTMQAGMPESEQCYDAKPLEENNHDLLGFVDLPFSTEWNASFDKRGFRLLTEAEWEYACRSGTRTAFSFGSDRTLLGQYGWSLDNSGQWSHGVARLRPNLGGLFDIHGNLIEWCHDWYSETPGAGPDEGWGRVVRGGCWSIPVNECRSSNRYGNIPRDRDANKGFRIALVPSASGC